MLTIIANIIEHTQLNYKIKYLTMQSSGCLWVRIAREHPSQGTFPINLNATFNCDDWDIISFSTIQLHRAGANVKILCLDIPITFYSYKFIQTIFGFLLPHWQPQDKNWMSIKKAFPDLFYGGVNLKWIMAARGEGSQAFYVFILHLSDTMMLSAVIFFLRV